MSWARIDDGFHDHPKVDELSLSAVGLWTLCLTWAHRHRRTAIIPGHITEARVRKIAGKQADALVAELVAARLWDAETHLGGWVIHDFAEYLPKHRDDDERRQAGRKGAAKRWEGHSKPDGNLPSTDMGNGMASDSSRASAPASPSRPVPKEGSSVGGEGSETLQHEPTPSKIEYAGRCQRHRLDPDPPPCIDCKNQRLRDAREADLRAVELENAIRECPDCEGTGKVLNDAKLPTRKTCDHPKVRRSA